MDSVACLPLPGFAVPVPPGTAAATGTPPNVVFLGACGGAGHDGLAQALAELLQRQPEHRFQSTRVDIRLDNRVSTGLWPLPGLARIRYHLHGAWALLYQATDRPWVVRACAAMLRAPALRWLRAQCPPAPDLLVAVHFGAAQHLQALAAGWARRPRTAIVVSDYDAHWAWFGQADLLVVASAAAAARARAVGVPEDRLLVLPLLPCRRAPGPRRASRPGERLRVLVDTGADGTSAGRLQAVLALLDACPSGRQLRLDVVCGRNAALQRTMTEVASRLQRLEVHVQGAVDDLPRRLAEADLALLHAHPQTLTEALAAGTPVVAFDWHAHEAANAALLQRLGCGQASCDPLAVADTVARVAARVDDTLARWTRAAVALGAAAPGEALVTRLLQGVRTADPEPAPGRR